MLSKIERKLALKLMDISEKINQGEEVKDSDKAHLDQMRWSYEAGFTYGYHCGSEDIPLAGDLFDEWLNEVAAEGVSDA